MIYVTVGGPSSYGFLRLIKKMDEITPSLDHEVVMQLGNTKYEPTYATSFRYNSFAESTKLFTEAYLVVSHCSTGTVLNAKTMRAGRPTIVMPRRKKHDEHFDDHQMELAKLIERDGVKLGIAVVYEDSALEHKVKELLKKECFVKNRLNEGRNHLLQYLEEYISKLGKR